MDKLSNLFIQTKGMDSTLVKYPYSDVTPVDRCYLTIVDDNGKELIEIGLHPLQCDVETVIPLSDVINFYIENAPRPKQTPYLYTDDETTTQRLLDDQKKEVV
jgi:hypothetical protein|tara:strand:- start:683 stop:991 length:309 start_codon:yes stop_codon:yes gene_type:complete